MAFTRRPLILAGCVVCNLFVWALSAYFLAQAKEQYERRAEIQSENIALAIDQDLSNSIEKADLVLRDVVEDLEVAGAGSPRQMEAELARDRKRVPYLNGIRMTDAAGTVIHGEGGRENGESFAGSAFFQWLRDHPEAGLQISPPRVGSISHSWGVALARRYRTPDGRFAGMVTSSIPLSHFSQELSRFDIGPSGVISLRHADFALIARFPAGAGPLHQVGNREVIREVGALVRAGVLRRTLRGRSPTDNKPRIFTFHRLQSAPMIVTVGFASNDYLAPWREDLARTAALAGIFLLLSLVSLLSALRAYRRAEEKHQKLLQANEELQQAVEALRVSESKLRIIFDNELYAVCIFNLDTGKILDVNQAHVAIYGYSREELIGMTAYQLSAEPEESRQSVREIVETGPRFVPLRYHRKKDGTAFPVEIVGGAYEWNGQKVMFGLVHDITERVKAEVTLKSYARRLIVLEEDLRKEVSRELHDDIGQQLTALGLNLAFLKKSLKEPVAHQLTATLEDSRQLTKEISRSVRQLMVELRPSQLEDYGLASALSSFAVQFGKRSGLEMELVIDQQLPRLPVKQEIALFRIAQEALNNVVKHAAATRVRVGLCRVGRALELCIADNGRGFAPGEPGLQPTNSGWGLTIMRERAELAGGTMQIDSAPGRGTEIVVEVGAPAGEATGGTG